MTDFYSPLGIGMGRSDASCAVCKIMKVSLGDEGDACLSKNAPAASYFRNYGVYIIKGKDINEYEQANHHRKRNEWGLDGF